MAATNIELVVHYLYGWRWLPGRWVMYNSAYLFPFFASLCWVTDEGETDAASLACCENKAFCTAGGRAVPYGMLSPSAHRTRIANKPEREPVFLPYTSSGWRFPGVGVVERVISSGLRFVAEVFLRLVLSQDDMSYQDCSRWNATVSDRHASRRHVVTSFTVVTGWC